MVPDERNVQWTGKGAFALRKLPKFSCVGTFWGYDLGWNEPSAYAALHEPADPTTGQLWPYVRGSKLANMLDVRVYVTDHSPARRRGTCRVATLREFARCPVLYMNEPPIGEDANCGWGPVQVDQASGLTLHQRIYSLRDIEPGAMNGPFLMRV